MNVSTKPVASTAPLPSVGNTYWRADDSSVVLLHGDALELMPEFELETVDCIWTDPPYLLSNGGISCSAGRRVLVDKGEWDKSNGLTEDMAFCDSWIEACRQLLKPAGCIWVSGTLHIHPIVGVSLLKSGFRILNDIVWQKPNPPPNLGCRTFTHSTELVYWATKAPKGGKHRYTFNYREMKSENGGKQMKTVWDYTAPGADEKRHGKHPTQKPVELIRRCIRASTNPGDLVLDPFVGSGSTGIAAVLEGRRFVGIDADERYLEVAARRLQQLTPPPPRRITHQMAIRMAYIRHHKTTQPRTTQTTPRPTPNQAHQGCASRTGSEGWNARRRSNGYSVLLAKTCESWRVTLTSRFGTTRAR